MINLEDSKPTPDNNNSLDSSSEMNIDSNKEEKIKEFSDFLEKASNQKESYEEVNLESNKQKNVINAKSIFKRILYNGFDGITTNPNYKLLALLIILMINLSVFFAIGNIGKAFLRNAGILS